MIKKFQIKNSKLQKRGLLLFEVVVVVLLVSLISLFFFRGYGVFLKAGKKSLDYLNLCLFLEEKIFKLQVEEAENKLSPRSYLPDDEE
ncbi:MAG: hypothetical protein JW867_00110, partial [Candidatus Omnitrophica bacterium]|nr:hypothetical protein [Candidatus Omnitrophota bacterium]